MNISKLSISRARLLIHCNRSPVAVRDEPAASMSQTSVVDAVSSFLLWHDNKGKSAIIVTSDER